MAQLDFSIFRNDFPMLKKMMHGKPLIYFDTAATAQKPYAVINAISNFYQNDYGTVHRAVYQLAAHATEAYQDVRFKVKNLLNARSVDEIVFTRGTTSAINLVARSFGKVAVFAGDTILISQIEHHSNIVPWQMLCEERGAVLKIIPVNDAGEIDLEGYRALLDHSVKLVSIAHISNVLGTIHPIDQMTKWAHEVGAKVLIDGAQSAPHMPIDLQKIDADFFVFSGHKFYGPTGIGILFGKAEHLEKMPPIEGGGDMIDKVSLTHSSYQRPPLKFEAGTPMIAEVIGLGAAIDYSSKIGMQNIYDWESQLSNYAERQLLNFPEVTIIGNAEKKGAIISFVVKGIHPLDLATILDFKGIAMRSGHLCSQPTMERFNISSTARISFGLYNTLEEIDLFAGALKGAIFQLRT